MGKIIRRKIENRQSKKKQTTEDFFVFEMFVSFFVPLLPIPGRPYDRT